MMCMTDLQEESPQSQRTRLAERVLTGSWSQQALQFSQQQKQQQQQRVQHGAQHGEYLTVVKPLHRPWGTCQGPPWGTSLERPSPLPHLHPPPPTPALTEPGCFETRMRSAGEAAMERKGQKSTQHTCVLFLRLNRDCFLRCVEKFFKKE